MRGAHPRCSSPLGCPRKASTVSHGRCPPFSAVAKSKAGLMSSVSPHRRGGGNDRPGGFWRLAGDFAVPRRKRGEVADSEIPCISRETEPLDDALLGEPVDFARAAAKQLGQHPHIVLAIAG